MSLAAGTRLGPYEVLGLIGAGGMGEVYRARDPRLGREVAIKILPADKLADPVRRARFVQEARAASALSHPNIVTIHEIEAQGDIDFLVMEYVAGRTLDTLIPRQGMRLGEALRIAIPVADALAAAHGAGIVHRDLKPQNVLVTDEGRVKVLDFGLAKISAATGPDAATLAGGLTLEGTVLGTPAYMSPEQAEGRPVDARSDIFSFGTLLYQLLTARLPFQVTSYATAVLEIVHGDPVPLARTRPDTPPALVAVVERCLRKDPAERFVNGAALRDALEAVQRGDAGTAPEVRRPDTPTPAGRPPARHRAWMIAGAAVLIAATAWLLSPGLRRTVDSGVAHVVPRAAPQPFALYSEGMKDLDRYWEPDRLDAAAALFQQAIARDAAYAPAHAALALTSWRRFRINQDQALLDRALANARRAVELDPQLALGHVALGHASSAARRIDEAAAAFTRALELDPLNAQAWRGQGDVAMARDRLDAAHDAYSRAIALAPASWEFPVVLGVLEMKRGRYAEALSAYERSAALSPDNPIPYRNVGAAQHMLGNFPAAASAFQRSLEIRPDPIVYGNLGTLYYFQGLYEQAIPAFEKAVALDPNNWVSWRNVADAYRQSAHRLPEAGKAYERAIQLLRERVATDPGDGSLRAELALCLARTGRVAEARLEAAHLDPATSADPDLLYMLVLAREAMGDRDGALVALDRALATGYSREEIRKDPELVALRKDIRYHRLLADRP